MAPGHFDQRRECVLADGVARGGAYAIDQTGRRAVQLGAVVGRAQADAEGILVLAQPPFVGQLGQVQLQVGVGRGGAGDGLATLVPADASALYARNVLDFLKLVLDKEGKEGVDIDAGNELVERIKPLDRKSTRLNSSHNSPSRMPSSA